VSNERRQQGALSASPTRYTTPATSLIRPTDSIDTLLRAVAMIFHFRWFRVRFADSLGSFFRCVRGCADDEIYRPRASLKFEKEKTGASNEPCLFQRKYMF
jgi:hypothetical protein